LERSTIRDSSNTKRSDEQLNRTLVTAIVLTLGITAYEVLADTPGGIADRLQRVAVCQLALISVAASCFILNLACSIAYLTQHKSQSDALAAISAQVGVLCCSILLIVNAATTRYLFATWWKWDDAQTSVYLILWFIYASYLLLRHFAKSQLMVSGFGVFAFCNLPLAYLSGSLGRPQMLAILKTTWTTSSESLLKHVVMFGTLATLIIWTRYRAFRREQIEYPTD
jgi:heme exporter protein C